MISSGLVERYTVFLALPVARMNGSLISLHQALSPKIGLKYLLYRAISKLKLR